MIVVISNVDKAGLLHAHVHFDLCVLPVKSGGKHHIVRLEAALPASILRRHHRDVLPHLGYDVGQRPFVRLDHGVLPAGIVTATMPSGTFSAELTRAPNI